MNIFLLQEPVFVFLFVFVFSGSPKSLWQISYVSWDKWRQNEVANPNYRQIRHSVRTFFLKSFSSQRKKLLWLGRRSVFWVHFMGLEINLYWVNLPSCPITKCCSVLVTEHAKLNGLQGSDPQSWFDSYGLQTSKQTNETTCCLPLAILGWSNVLTSERWGLGNSQTVLLGSE